jgi:hypothetical protein
MFRYTALGSGYYSVIVDDAVVSKHTAEREALENANCAKLANPAARVVVSHDYEVEVEFEEAPSFVDASVGQTVSVTLRSSDPDALSVSGAVLLTPLKETDVELSLEVVS